MKGGSTIRVGIFLDFASLSTRTPHGAYVQAGGRNRLDPHWGGIERLARVPLSKPPLVYLVKKKSDNIFRVGILLDFVRLTTRTEGPHGGPHGDPHGGVRAGGQTNRIDPHWGGIERPARVLEDVGVGRLAHSDTEADAPGLV